MDRLRTIDNAAVEIREQDPNTDLTAWALRQLVRSGEIPALMIGNKQLISLEAVERYINSQVTRGDNDNRTGDRT